MAPAHWQPDGALIHRHPDDGARIAVLPARCRRGEHALAVVGFRARFVDPRGHGLGAREGNVLEVACEACLAGQLPRYAWWLGTDGGPRAELAELDDRPYVMLRDPLAPLPAFSPQDAAQWR